MICLTKPLITAQHKIPGDGLVFMRTCELIYVFLASHSGLDTIEAARQKRPFP